MRQKMTIITQLKNTGRNIQNKNAHFIGNMVVLWFCGLMEYKSGFGFAEIMPALTIGEERRPDKGQGQGKRLQGKAGTTEHNGEWVHDLGCMTTVYGYNFPQTIMVKTVQVLVIQKKNGVSLYRFSSVKIENQPGADRN
jgi:hypothetical protein